jgi:putative DNA primase/helicase
MDGTKPTPNRREAARFLRLLDPGATTFTFQTFDDNKERHDRRLARVLHGTLADCWDQLSRLNAQGAGVFVCVNETDGKGRTEKNIERVRALFVDLDGAPLDPVRQSDRPPHIMVASSSGRWQAFWLAAIGGIKLEQFSALQKGLAARYGGDAVHDLPRVMRVPGFLHCKRQPHLVHIIGTTVAAAVTADDFQSPSGDDKIDQSTLDDDAGKGTAAEKPSPWQQLNHDALAHLELWVPELFPTAKPYRDGYRVPSADLNRDLDEDLSLTPRGIRDFGVHDLGDQREGRRSPIDVVMERGKKDFNEAVVWLQARFGGEAETGSPHADAGTGAGKKKEEASAKEARILVDPKDPMMTARKILATSFTTLDGVRTLWRHRGTFWSWTGTHFALADDETLRARVWGFLDKAVRREGLVMVPFKPTRARVGEVIDALVAVCQLDEHISPPAWLSPGPPMAPAGEFFACGNGLLHLPTGTLHPPTPAYFCLNASTVIYDSAAASPTQWLTFLKQLFRDDVPAIEMLQEWFGYALSPDTSQQKIGAIIGPKRSGKGTIARVLTKILSAHSVAGPTMNSLGETFGLEPLITAPLAIVSDVRIGQRTDKSTIVERLLSVSGEDQMTVARKYIRAWTGKLPTRFLLLTNELPALSDGSGALAGRMIVLVLTTSFFGKEDAKLTQKLIAESAGILSWSMDGYRRLAERGHFIQPKSGESAVDDIETLGAPVRAFVRDCCVVGPAQSVKKDDLFQTWKHWCADENRKDAGTKEWFGRNLHSTEPSVSTTRPSVNNGAEREWRHQGIGLNAAGAVLLKNGPAL